MVTVTEDSFGKTKAGQEVTRYTFSNSKNVTVRVINYGCAINEIHVPDRTGKVSDIALGFDNIEGFQGEDNVYIGAVIGRVASRISGAECLLEGQKLALPKNSPPNFLHGGVQGFDKKVWDGKVSGPGKVTFTYVSADGEEGFPGEMTTTLTYELTEEGEFVMDYTATTTKTTLVNLTNHAYFNLAGHDKGSIDDHVASVMAESFLPQDEHHIPTGELAPVEGRVEDLRLPVRLGELRARLPAGKGLEVLDNNYVLKWSPGTLEGQLAARVEHPPTGRFLECYTTEPAVQFYTSYYNNVKKGKEGASYLRNSAFCTEAQHHTDSPNKPNFPSIVLRPEQTYRQITSYKFGVTPQ